MPSLHHAEDGRTPGFRAVRDRFLVVGFLLGISLPLTGAFVDLDPTPELGAFHITPPSPTMELSWESLRTFPDRFEEYYDDRFGFRRTLVRWDRVLRYRLFGVADHPWVVAGKDHWLYLSTVAHNHRAAKPLSEEKLAQWRGVLQERHDWLARQGIRYLVVLAPDKSSIYPEHLTDTFRSLRQVSRLDQLVQELRDRSDVELVDLREVLLPERDRRPLYSPTDSHWNDVGAFIAAEEIVRALSRWFPTMAEVTVEPTFDVRRTPGGDLAEILGVEDLLMQELPVVDIGPPRATLVADLAETRPWFTQCRVMETGIPSLPRAVMFRDSFAIRLVPFLSEYFQRIAYPWFLFIPRFDPAIVLDEKPDVVIDQLVERYLGVELNPVPNPISVADLPGRFASASEVLFRMAPGPARDTRLRARRATLQAGPEGLRIQALSRGPSVVVPSFRTPPGTVPALRIEIDAPAATRLRVLPEAPDRPEFLPGRASTVSLVPGRNLVHLFIDEPRFAGRLRVDVGTVVGNYLLRDLEIRAVPP